MDGESGDAGRDKLTWVGWEECEGEWLGWGWQNDAESWFIATCEASRFDSNSNPTIPIDSKVTGQFEIFESVAPAVVPQTKLILQQKTSIVESL